MGETAKRIMGVVMALVMAAWVAPTAQADWLARAGNVERTGFTAEAVLPPVSLAWTYATDPGNTYYVNPIIAGEMIYWVTDRDLTAMRADMAIPVWRFQATGRIRSSPAYADGTLYFGADNSVFYALDAATGEIKWHVETERSIRSAPAVVEGVVYFGNNDAKVYALDAATGKEKWVYEAGDDVYAAIATTQDTVWVACTDSTLYAVDARRGLERWRIPFIGAGGLYFAPAVEGRRAYLAVKDRIYQVGASGMVTPCGEALPARVSAPPALGRRCLYVGCQNGTLYALDKTRGRVKWTYKLPGAIEAQPLVAGNLVVAGGSHGEVVALDADSGEVRWVYGQHAPWASWVPERKVNYQLMAAVASGGDLYLSWDDGNLARFAASALDISPPHISRRTPEPGSPAKPVSPTEEIVIGANVYDEGSGLAPASVTMTLDGKPLALSRRANGDYYHALRGTTAAPALEDGWHTVALTAEDQRGNKIADTWTFLSRREVAEEPGVVEPGVVGTTERF